MSKEIVNRVAKSKLITIDLEDFRKVIYNEVRKIHTQRFPYNHFLYPDLEE